MNEVRNEGRDEGRDEGRAEGEIKGKIALIERQLRRRFGQLSPHHETAIRRLSLERLETLSEDLLDFHAEADLAAWIGRET
ncbi:hypothetical protein CCP3SC15_3080001 [Gammaproteobacteria bacterium]